MRQRESYLRKHIVPRFGDAAPHTLNLSALQQFATDLRKVLSRKTVINVLGTIFAIVDYAGRCGTLVSKVSFEDIELRTTTQQTETPFFTREEVVRIIEASDEPYKTMFALAYQTGLRAGELPSALEAVLRNYLKQHWKPNIPGLLFPNRKGTKPRWRDNVVKYGLKPVLKKLGIPAHDVGLHAFRHGLATELADTAVPLPALQQQMRHADVRTTLRVYAHVIPASQREAMERIGNSISTAVPIGTNSAA